MNGVKEFTVAGHKRYIGSHEGHQKGPLVIAIGGMHGNELAGIRALDLVFKMLEVEPITNPDFEFKGKLIGLIGNVSAVKSNKRFIDKDLNRLWTEDNIADIKSRPTSGLLSEERELILLLKSVQREIRKYNPEKLVVLDLHTTSANDGIFSIPTGTPESFLLAKGLFAPVISDLTENLRGTIMSYLDGVNLGVPTVAVSFEAGQHEDPLSINRAVAAVVNCLRFEGLIRSEDVESRHDEILKSDTKSFPKLAKMIYKHPFRKKEKFKMRPGYKNFSVVLKGEHLADDIHGKIIAPHDGYILMPLYQSQGSEGFFIVMEEEF